MTHRIGFRWLLPLVLTSVHVGLLLVAAPHAHRASHHAEVQYRTVALQEGEAVEWQPMEPRPLFLQEKVAVILNLPALLVAIPIAAYAFHGADRAIIYAATPFVPVLWYFIGRWIDTKLGILPVHSPRVPGAKIRRALMVVAGAMFLLTGLIGFLALFRTKSADTLLMSTGFLLWGALFLVLCVHPCSREYRP